MHSNNSVTYTLTYDAENRLVGVSGGTSASFVYEGDGQRVKATFGSSTTAYVGDYFEWKGSTSTMVKYYYAGSQRVAMRVGSSTVYYLLTDHLGSTAVTANASGGKYGELRHKAWGETRYSWGTTPTAYKFTGQRLDDSTGLYYYRARYYDPVLGRFVQADTIVPEPGNPQALNRYAYVLNNPLRYTDPTGMFSEDEIMKYLGVDSWDAVLALFEEGGRYAGLWGWLEVLRRAEIGSTFGIYGATGAQIFYGHFAQTDTGHLFLEGEWLQPLQGWVFRDGKYFYAEQPRYTVLMPEAAAWLDREGGYYVSSSSFDARTQYNRLRIERNIDWVGVGFDLGGVAADAVSFGAAGRIVNAAQVAKNAEKIGQALNVTSVGYDLGSAAVELYQEGRLSGATARSLVYSGAGFIPGLGTISDVVSAFDGIFCWGP